MKKRNIKWTIRELAGKFELFEFPEFQREPTVWNLQKKQKLIDSILREFDIASIYVHKTSKGNYECIDGRQRINAILSYLGLNADGNGKEQITIDNKFKFKLDSFDELGAPHQQLKKFDKKTFEDLAQVQKNFILNYEFNVLEIEEIKDDKELNLMFLRLQLGAPLNAGEKLNAMVGDMRDFIFSKAGSIDHLGNHPYFHLLQIPQRRYAKELIASQVAMNYFSQVEKNTFTRSRFEELQEFFSKNHTFNENTIKIARLLKQRLAQVHDALKGSTELEMKNRAIGLTVFFFIVNLLNTNRATEIPRFTKFLTTFLTKLKTEVKKGIHMDKNYQDLLNFQTYISQAAVEKYAIENRQTLLEDYFEYWKQHKKIKKLNN